MTNQNSRQRDDFEIFIPLQLEDLALKLESAFLYGHIWHAS